MSANSEIIAKRFFEAVKATAEAHGLYLTEAKKQRAGLHALFIWEGPPESGKRLWLLYYKVSAKQPPFLWGLRKGILETMESRYCEKAYRSGVVLLEPDRGRFLDAQYIAQHRGTWSLSKKDGEYKITERDLPDSAHLLFSYAANCSACWDFLGL